MSLEAAGPNLAEFGELIFNKLPETGTFRISGRLTGSFGKLALADANAKLQWGGVCHSPLPVQSPTSRRSAAST